MKREENVLKAVPTSRERITNVALAALSIPSTYPVFNGAIIHVSDVYTSP
jgi:hypothetical protein